MTLVDQKATWLAVCSIDDLLADRGVCALVGPYQVAIFRLSAGGGLYVAGSSNAAVPASTRLRLRLASGSWSPWP